MKEFIEFDESSVNDIDYNMQYVPDEDVRVHWLMDNYLIQVKVHINGWNMLYIDPDYGRFWELIFHFPEAQNGGPWTLLKISYEDAISKYFKK